MSRSGKKRFYVAFLLITCLSSPARAQDTSGVVRMDHGMPLRMLQISGAHSEASVQKRGMKLARKNGYPSKNDWNDTLRYWTDGMDLRAVSFINASYEHTTIIFGKSGAWLQTATYLNPEFNETSRILTALDEKGYGAPALSSPVGPIIKYRTVHDSWYEAQVYERKAPELKATVVLDGEFRVVTAR